MISQWFRGASSVGTGRDAVRSDLWRACGTVASTPQAWTKGSIMTKRGTLLFLVAAMLVVAAIYRLAPWSSKNEVYDQRQQEREAYAAFLAAHPYSQHQTMSEAALQALPKNDRPDLAAEQDFLMTMDPATLTVPMDRLWNALEQAGQTQGRGSFSLITNPWSERGPDNVGGRTRGIMWDPNTTDKFWAGGVDGGLWFTNDITNASTPWSNVDDFWANLAVSSITYDPTNTNTYYAGTGEGFFNFDAVQGAGIFKSTDAGANWSQLASTTTSTFEHVQDVVVHPTTGDVYAATRADGVMRSQNGGTSWSQVLGFPHGTSTERAADLEVGADGSLYAAMGIFTTDGIYKSPAGGTVGDAGTWTKLNTAGSGFPTTGIERIDVATAPSDANRLYAVAQDGGTAIEGLYRSDNAGATWTAITTPVDLETCTIPAGDFSRGQAWYDLIIEVDPLDEDVAIVGAIDLFRTTDAGANWTQISVWTNGCSGPSSSLPVVHADQHAISYRPGSSTEIVFGHDGGVDYTSTGASKSSLVPTYINRNVNYNVTQFYSAAQHPTAGSNIMLGGTQDNGTHRFTSGGLGSTAEVFGGDGGFTFIDQDTPTQAITATTNNRWRRSFDTGVSFSDAFLQGTGNFINQADYDDAADILFATRNANEVLRLSDFFGSISDTPFTTSLLGGAQASAFKVSPFAAPSSTVFVGSENGRIVKMTNAETGSPTFANADPSGTLPVGNISSIELGASENQILVTFSNYGVVSVWETTDGGTTWVNKEGNLPDMPVRWALYNPGQRLHVVLATEVGTWETADITATPPTWVATATMPTVRVDMLQLRLSDGMLMASTHGRGVWTSTFTTPLPVELVSFDVLADGRSALLTWETASETNNAGFEVQHFPGDGSEIAARETPLPWSVVDWVDGHGTTEVAQRYAYRLDDLAPGRHRFRLKQIDFDGTFEYSPEIEVIIEMVESFVMEPAYPNPFNPEAQFRFAVLRPQRVQVALFDVAGRQVRMLYEGEPTPGQLQTVRIDGGGLSSGSYLVRVAGESFVETQQITLVK